MRTTFRRILGAILIVVSLVVTQVPAMQVKATDPDYQLDGEILVKYTGSGETIEIPASVKIIGEEAFAGNDNIRSIQLADGIKEIRYHAFFDCDNLESISTGDGCKLIGNGAFADCEKLSDAYLGANVEDFGSGVFAGDKRLSSVAISENNEHLQVAGGAIYNGNATHLYQLLSGSKVSDYRMPDTVTSISKYAFWGCDALKYAELSGQLEDIPAYSFSNCRNLNMLTVPFSATYIGAKAFENCSGLKAIEIPDSVSSIHETAFDGCGDVHFIVNSYSPAGKYVKSRKLDTISKVEYEELLSHFLDGLSQQAADMESEDATMDELNAGSDASEENDLDSQNGADNQAAVERDGVSGADGQVNTSENGQNANEGGYQTLIWNGNGTVIEQPQGARPGNASEDSSSSQEDARETQDSGEERIPSDIANLETYVVSDMAMVFVDNTTQRVYQGGIDTPLEYEDVLRSMIDSGGESAGEVFPELQMGASFDKKGLYIPKYTVNETQIADHAFYANHQMDAFAFPADITVIGEFSFARTPLQSISIPSGVTTIEQGAFYHCSNLKEVTIPSTVTRIEPYAFESTDWLSSFYNGTLGDSDFLIVGDGILLAYRGREAKVTVPSGVKRIGTRAFAQHYEMVSIEIPDSVSVIQSEAFYACSGLSSITWGGNVRTIEDRAFYGCPINTISIPASVEEIGVQAFDKKGTIREGEDSIIIFEGMILPRCINCKDSRRYYTPENRGYCFPDAQYAVIKDSIVPVEGTVLDPYQGGFRGIILCMKDDETDEEVDINPDDDAETDGSGGEAVKGKYLSVQNITVLNPQTDSILIPESLLIYGVTYLVNANEDEVSSYYDNLDYLVPEEELGRINMTVDSSVLQNHGLTDVAISGNAETLFVSVADSSEARQLIYDAYMNLYTNSNVFTLDGFEIAATDAYGIPLTQFGSHALELTLEAPEDMQTGLLYVLTLDQDGQLEAVDADTYDDNGIRMVHMKLKHLSPYALLCFNDEYSESIRGTLDATPDTGDFMHQGSKWILFAFLFASGAFLLLWRLPIHKKKH